MEERTEEDVVAQTGVTVVLGGKDFEVKPLVSKYSREWRKKSVGLITYILDYGEYAEADTSKALQELFGTKADEIIDSFFEYARDLNRDEIESIATDGEIMMAFVEVFHAFVSPLSLARVKAQVRKRSR